ncbi:MAG: hypothetical protein M1530_02525, partial [Candidatus Marsarchaeota archaeon]|nr:hypothetical protein [Candidatus Marsarchaeota archaeon]
RGSASGRSQCSQLGRLPLLAGAGREPPLQPLCGRAHRRHLHRTVIEDQRRMVDSLRGKPDGAAEEGNGPGADLHFVEDSRLGYFLDNGYSVLVRRNFTKEEVIAEAVAGRPLPPKSTRHMIPNRIIRLNVHLGYLNETPEAAWNYISEMVRKRVRYGSARYYTEPVIVLY